MNRKRMFFIVTVIFLCLGSAVPVFASVEEDFGNTDKTLPEMTQIVELQKGEALFLPGNGMVQIADERIACAGRNGNIEALEEGETEVVVRYKIRVKKTDSKENTDEMKSDKNGKDTADLEKTQTGDTYTDKDAEEIQGGTADENQNTEDGIKDMEETENGNGHEEAGRTETARQPSEEAEKNESARQPSKEKEDDTPTAMTEIEIPDRVYPVIALVNLKNLSSSNTQVSPCITVQDENLDKDSVKIRLTGKRTGERTISFRKEENRNCLTLTLDPVTEDDEYVLICEACDLYGNRTEQHFLFSVNQSGTSFVYDREEIAHNGGFTPEITLDNVDAVRIVSCSVNGEPVLYEWKEGKLRIPSKYLKNGKNRITLSVKDTAGNISDMEPWDFTMPANENAETDTEPVPEAVKMQKENPAGIIFLLIGSVLVFWERKMCYNGNIN